jgi:hypothetical protein
MLLSFLSMGSLFAQSSSKKMKTGIAHNVYFWLKNPESQSDKDSLFTGLQTLLAIKEIKEVYIGTPAPTMERGVIDHTYSMATIFIFKTAADQDAYQVHPIHKAFVEKYSHLWERVVVYDVQGK